MSGSGFGLFLRPRSTGVLKFRPLGDPYLEGFGGLGPGIEPTAPGRSGLSKPWRPQAQDQAM